MSLADIKARISSEAQEQVRAIEAENNALVAGIEKRKDSEIKAIRDAYRERMRKL